YRETLKKEYFEGLILENNNGVELNISTSPRVGFFEFNIIIEDIDNLRQMADYIQITTNYILHHFNKYCDSYNLFFYQYENRIIAKAMPRFITSPIYIGYAIPQISNRLKDVIQEFRELYNLSSPTRP
ncbi:MAG: DUF4931 domain-containing protein, partial [Peptococcales bacterium]